MENKPITSTPVKNSRQKGRFSPDISNVSFFSESSISSHKPRHAEILQCRSTSGSSISSSVTFNDSVKQIRQDGQDWKHFKPKRDSGLYYDLLTAPFEYEETAQDWLHLFKTKSHDGMVEFIQFIVDICGFDVLVNEFYLTNTMSVKDIIRIIEQNPGNEVKSGKYLFKLNQSVWLRNTQQVILEFVMAIVRMDKDELLYWYNEPNSILKFIMKMTNSSLRALSHTAVVISLKMLTEYNKLYVNYMNKEESVVGRIIDELFYIFRKHSKNSDPKLFNMRADSAYELSKWFSICPEKYFENNEAIRCLLELVIDVVVRVRMCSLETCHNLIQNNETLPFLQPYRQSFVEAVGGRIQDVNDKVAIKAINIFCTMLKIKTFNIQRHMNHIFIRIFHDNFPLASAAGRFYIGCIRHFKECTDSESMIKHIVKFFSLEEFQSCTARLVESTLDYTPELQDWKTLINLLLVNERYDYYRCQLVMVICQSIIQVLTGESSDKRTKSRKAPVNWQANVDVAKVLLPSFLAIVNNFAHNEKCLIHIIEVLLVINYHQVPMTEYMIDMNNIFNCLYDIFKDVSDFKLAMQICKTFEFFSESLPSLQSRAQVIISLLKETVVDKYHKITTLDENVINPEVMQETENMWMQMSALMRHFNLTNLIDWTSIFTDKYISDPNCLRYQFPCCIWFLVWQLHRTSDRIVGTSKKAVRDWILQVKQRFQTFSILLFGLLKSEEPAVCEETIKALCDGYMQIHDAIKDILKNSYDFETLSVKLTDEDVLNDQFLDALIIYIIKNENMELQTRRSYLGIAINLIFAGVIDFQALVKILRFYQQYFQDFGDIFENALDKVKEFSFDLIILIVLHILLSYFEDLSICDSDSFSKEHEDTKALLTLLAKLNASVLKDLCLQRELFYMGIFYILQNPKSINFIYFLKHYVNLLDTSECEHTYNRLKSNIAPEFHKNEAFIIIMTLLKNKLSKKQATLSETTTCDESVLEEMEIDDGDQTD